MPVIPHYKRNRAPLAADDRTQRIFKDSIWADEDANRLYRSDDDSPNAAVWTDITPAGQGSSGPVHWNDVQGKPSTFMPSQNPNDIPTLPVTKVDTLESTLNAKAEAAAVQSQLDSKQPLLGFTPQNVSQKGQPNGYPSLGADGLVPASQLPPSGGGAWTTVKATSDESKNNLAVVADDNTLAATLLANTQYSIRLIAFFLTNATADLKYRLVFTGTVTRVRRRVKRTATTDIAQTIELKIAFDSADVVLSTTGLNPWLEEDILLQVGASGGVLKLQWGQVVSNAGPTTRLEGSYLEFMVA